MSTEDTTSKWLVTAPAIKEWLDSINEDGYRTDDERTAARILLRIVEKDIMKKEIEQAVSIPSSVSNPPFDPPYRDNTGKLIDKEEVMNNAVTAISTSNPKEYRVVATGSRLVRKPGMFHWRGQDFSGLVDVNKNALYDDPEDSFAAVTGMKSSLEQGLIEVVPNDFVVSP